MGGDPIPAKNVYKKPFRFDPTHKLILATNHPPIVSEQDVAIWRRLRLVRFGVTIPEHERDEQLPLRLLHELPGVLNWAAAAAATRELRATLEFAWRVQQAQLKDRQAYVPAAEMQSVITRIAQTISTHVRDADAVQALLEVMEELHDGAQQRALEDRTLDGDAAA